MDMLIIQTASNTEKCNTFIAALKAAHLSDSLNQTGPFTVFAPCDDAFAKLPAGTIEGMLKDKDRLASLLTYHILQGEVMAKEIATMQYVKTLQGEDVTITVIQGSIMINNAKVLQADIQCSNGIIYIIDTVLIPKQAKIVY